MDVHPTKNGIFIGIDPYPCLWTLIAACFHQTTLHKSSFGRRGAEAAVHKFFSVPRHVQCLSQTLEGLLENGEKRLCQALYFTHTSVCRYFLNKKIEVDRIWMIWEMLFFFCTGFNVGFRWISLGQKVHSIRVSSGDSIVFTMARRWWRRGAGAVFFRWSN